MGSESWPEVSLEDVADELTVGHVGSMASDYQPCGVPFLRSQNILPFRIDLDDVKYVSTEFHHRLRKSALKPGDVVIVRTGKPGTAAVVPQGIGELNCSDLVIVRPGRDLSARFLCYYVNGVAHHHVNAHLVGAVQQHFNVGSARQMRLRLPPLHEQEAIAHILGTLDDKIELNRKMNETLEAMARAMFKSWFVDFDPVRAKAEGRTPAGMDAATAALFPDSFEDSALGPIPKGWDIVPLDEVARFRNGLALQRFRPKDGEPALPVIKIAQLRSGRADSGEWAATSIDPECIIEDGDVIFSWSGSLMVVVWGGGRGALNQHLFKVTSDRYPKWFYLYSTLIHLPEFQAIAADKATTMGHIKRHHLTDALCVAPAGEILVKVSKVFDPILRRQEVNSSEAALLEQTRDSLLPGLLSGAIDVGSESGGR